METDKGEENSPENSVGDRTAVEIRTEKYLYKGEERKRMGDWKNRERERERERENSKRSRSETQRVDVV